MKCCCLGFHDWRYFKRDKYPENVRICQRCGKCQELVYDFLTKWWSDNPHIPFKELEEVENHE